MKLRYVRVDVFTDAAFGGNPLAVFVEGHEVPETLMQKIAREMNLSETTFVLPSERGDTDYRLRIFTPAAELPMAGHPTVGSAFALVREARFPVSPPETRLVFEEGVGPVPVLIGHDGEQPSLIWMIQGRPTFGPTISDTEGLARILTLQPSDLELDHSPPQVVSCGLPFLFVRVRSLDAIRRIRLNVSVWEAVFAGLDARGLFVFTTETERHGSTVHSRMFAPALGVHEDPATGSASGPLGSYLVRHGLVEPGHPARIVSEQGFEIQRPSILNIEIDGSPERISEVRVGGNSVFMGRGELDLA